MQMREYTQGVATGGRPMRTGIFIALFIMLVPLLAFGWDYTIGEGDTLSISVWGEKDLSLAAAKVRPDGKITTPALGEVKAAGLTPQELQAALTAKLKAIVKNPVVTVIVTEITNNKLYIFGGGIKSGVYPLTQRTTLLQVLCMTENAKNADLKRAYVLRNTKKVKEDFTKLFIDGDTSEDVAVEPNDVIFIPTHADKNIYVMGAVNIPKSIEYREGLTTIEAILDAGGFTKFADQNDTVIYRREGGKEISIPVKIKKLVKDGNLSQNAKLKPGDYVVVKEGIF
jgi:polysaccharide export outer membrane protein